MLGSTILNGVAIEALRLHLQMLRYIKVAVKAVTTRIGL
jgi:hypothetical protein